MVFDGTALHDGACVVIDGGRITALLPDPAALPKDITLTDLGEGILTPGFVDVQVNGGGGVMLGGDHTGIDTIARICAAHARLGATAILTTLITDTPQATAQVIAAGIAAAKARIPGFLGLHLEGPHLDPRRAGAHDPRLIRPMSAADLTFLEQAARALPALMVTLAPEAASPNQIARLRQAGSIVALGHTDCTADQARAAFHAGASGVTHLFNAMSQLQGREAGLVGAALDSDAHIGLIADGIHITDTSLRLALRLKGKSRAFLVSDAMACAGTDMTGFSLNGRRIRRRNGALRLGDGTLAGADLALPQAVAHCVGLGLPLEQALALATSRPAAFINATQHGRLAPGQRADLVLLCRDKLTPQQIWQGGAELAIR
ncbi:MAG: N-acetylglucosamine-6-phosphate deacetylase [Rhodobacteraceae bacterium]|nr:N-acetylglucosamine-6-phosphate deacetylase [Paracoccaceae bacterium]